MKLILVLVLSTTLALAQTKQDSLDVSKARNELNQLFERAKALKVEIYDRKEELTVIERDINTIKLYLQLKSQLIEEKKKVSHKN